MASVEQRATAAEKRRFRVNFDKIATRHICDGREVDNQSLASTILDPFRSLGWTFAIEGRGPVHEDLIREFYSSYTFDTKEHTVRCHLRNKLHERSLELFGTYLGVPTEGVQFFSVGKSMKHLPNFLNKEQVWSFFTRSKYNYQGGMKASDLGPPHNMRYKVIDWNIYCRDGNHNEMQACEVAFLWCLEHQIQVNLAYFVANRMCGTISNGTRSLPYGILLNNLFRNLEIANLGPAREPHHQSLDLLTVERMKRTLSKAKSKRARLDSDSSEDEEEAYDYGIETGGASGSRVQEEGESEDEPQLSELPPEDPNDEFYRLPPERQTSVMYRQQLQFGHQQRKIRRDQKGIKKLLKEILDIVTCNTSKTD